MDLVGIALLIIGIAFAVLVGVIVPTALKLNKTVDEVNETIAAMKTEVSETISVLRSDADITFHQTNELLAKTNVLVEDVNGKVATIDPLFTAIADLSESVSDLNSQARNFGHKATATASTVSKAGTAFTIGRFASKLFRRKGD
ncbi:DUF948 domain-containing protein [Streptococcus chenjunshii]|uniref:DUF948 domain-containing protein n=1 Tax=Streptococcus chenjunshii TaxID=2173853 RepID=A0A372KLH7_9STRE|nr:DUF948 domain-containing protein [Streptococcus chenjunshii]AXQ79065.1 DUF948 domain-containing protein [Streptococcus chenjunshii]RFU51261.1 DUF948 domain-containing protein [Streptococcus chenjunshii]RFU53123.1 DUF948 domain-containing protein [Streptococcus chenjunshii]